MDGQAKQLLLWLVLRLDMQRRIFNCACSHLKHLASSHCFKCWLKRILIGGFYSQCKFSELFLAQFNRCSILLGELVLLSLLSIDQASILGGSIAIYCRRAVLQLFNDLSGPVRQTLRGSQTSLTGHNGHLDRLSARLLLNNPQQVKDILQDLHLKRVCCWGSPFDLNFALLLQYHWYKVKLRLRYVFIELGILDCSNLALWQVK